MHTQETCSKNKPRNLKLTNDYKQLKAHVMWLTISGTVQHLVRHTNL